MGALPTGGEDETVERCDENGESEVESAALLDREQRDAGTTSVRRKLPTGLAATPVVEEDSRERTDDRIRQIKNREANAMDAAVGLSFG